MSTASPRPWVVVAIVVFTLLAACTTSRNDGVDPSGRVATEDAVDPDLAGSDDGEQDAGSTTDPTDIAGAVPRLALDLRRSVGQVLVAGATPGARVAALPDGAQLTDLDRAVATARVTPDGSALIRGLAAGPVRIVLVEGGSVTGDGGIVSIPGEAPPAASHYRRQELLPGFGYVETRDGTTLSIFVSLPAGAGPFPTLVEYSGYAPSDPSASSDPGRLLIPQLGYALVQVNVRGTGCSGGSYDAFSRLEAIDGYDVVETVAAQSWSAGVGMFGVSYPGIMQLLVASTQPPNLAAIAPLSVIDRVDSVLLPGGIYNVGFGDLWVREVTEAATPRGARWVGDRIAEGDDECQANQRLRIHNRDLVTLARATGSRDDNAREKSPITWASDIEVPVFLAGAWQDEQTGPNVPPLIGALDEVPVLRATLYNGLHVDPLGPAVIGRLLDFYSLYVADRAPSLTPFQQGLLGFLSRSIFATPLPIDPPDQRTTLAEARRRFESEPPVHVLFEVGATAANLPVTNFEARFDEWPPPEVEPVRLYLADNGDLSARRPVDESRAPFTTRPQEGTEQSITDLDSLYSADPGWQWTPSPAANARSFTSAPIETELVLAGPGSVDLSVVLPDASDADLEATLTEIGPDGSETFVQTGVLRLSRRALDESSTELAPELTLDERDISPVVPGEVTRARVELPSFAHVYRPGSAIRVTIDTPGGSHARWAFDVNGDPVEVELVVGGDAPSSVVLPVIPSVDAPDERPPCGSLRGQPCRSP